MCRRALLSLFVAIGTMLAVARPAFAQEDYPRDGSGVEPLDRILPEIRNGRAGQFYDAEGPFPDASGGYHYRIKWLTPDGRVVWLDTDARSGRVLGVARGDWREQGPPPVGRGGYYGRGRGYYFRGPPGRFPPPGGGFVGPRSGGWHGGGWHGGGWHGGGGHGGWHGRGG